MKPYMIDGVEADAHDIITAAKTFGYAGTNGEFKSSEAANVLRAQGKKVEVNPNFPKHE